MIKQRIWLATIILLLTLPCLNSQTRQDSVQIYFRQGKTTIEPELHNNRQALDKIAGTILSADKDSAWIITRLHITGGASPEGSVTLNKWLSRRRAEVLSNYITDGQSHSDSITEFTYLGRDWAGLIRLVEGDPGVPDRTATLTLLTKIKEETDAGITRNGDQALRLRNFAGSRPWKYMYRNLFPELRASNIIVTYQRRPIEEYHPYLPTPPAIESTADTILSVDTITDVAPAPTDALSLPPFYMALKSNMLLDALLLPNIGAEFYLGKQWSLSAFWLYAWWKTDRHHDYWRAYGGDIELRRWFGKAAATKPLTGHHIGIYAQMFTYDLELGHKGYLGPKWSYGAGISYGYSLPVASRLNIDFGLSAGYQGGKYKEYKPDGDCYVWQVTKRRNWFGPTKAEISLVWLIGRGNVNHSKSQSK